MKNPFTMKNAVKKRSRKKAFSAEKPLGKRCKFYSREACYLEDCDTCIIKDAYEQGKEEQEEFDIRVIKAMKFNHQQEINETRKQTLEEVRKDLVHYEFEFSGASQEWIALYGFRKKLEHKIKEASK